MKYLIIFLLLVSCQQKPDTIVGKWSYKYAYVTFDSVLTVHQYVKTQTTYSVNLNRLTLDNDVMFFPHGTYSMKFTNTDVTLRGPATAILCR